MNSRSPFRGRTNILISNPGSTVLVWLSSDLAAMVTFHSQSIRLCIWTLHAACRLSSDPATHWTVCVRGEKRGRREGKEYGGKIGWDEDEDNERRACRRWHWGQSEMGRCNALSKTIWGIKMAGLSIRKICRDKAELDGRVWAKASQSEESRGEKKNGRECWRRDEVWRDGDSLQWW